MGSTGIPVSQDFELAGWLDYLETFFFFAYHGQNAVFNTMSFQNPALDKLIDAARLLAAKTLN